MSNKSLGVIHIVQWSNPSSEIAGLTRYIRHLTQQNKLDPGNILVITPRRKLAYPLRDAIDEIGVPVYSFYQEEALEEQRAQWAFSILALLADGEDRVALRWLLGTGGTRDRAKAYAVLRAHCEKVGGSPRQVLESISMGELKLSGVSALTRQFRKSQDDLTSFSRLELGEVVDRLFPSGCDDTKPLRDLAILILAEAKTVKELFESMRVQITQPEVPSGDFVQIMSPQKSKGLTREVVIVTGCVEGLYPVQDSRLSPSEQTELLREQRRLFYVALTRSSDTLVLSSFSNIDRGLAKSIGAQPGSGNRQSARTIASRFISELGRSAPRSRTGVEWESQNYR